MMTFLRRILHSFPPDDYADIREEAIRLSERNRELLELQKALREIREVSEKKQRELSSIPPPQLSESEET